MDTGSIATARVGRLVLAVALLAAVLLTGGCSDAPRPRQAGPDYRIGLITNNPNGLRNLAGFSDALHALGYREGENLDLLGSATAVPQKELEKEIRKLVAAGADLIFTAGTPTGIAAFRATADSDVPVVFGVIADPVKAGVMRDLTRPGDNMTGIMLSQNQARRLELLLNLMPGARRILVPYNPLDPAPISAVEQIGPVARTHGVELLHAHVHSGAEVTALLADFPAEVDAVFMLPDSTVNRRVKDLLKLTVGRKLPVSGPSFAQVEAGALISYGIVHREVGAQAAAIADRILRGESPAVLPVQTADFFMTVNMAAAERIAFEVPERYLQQADKIIYEDDYEH